MLNISHVESVIVAVSLSSLVIGWFGIIVYQCYKEIKLLRNIESHLDEMILIVRERN